jgi:adenine phosphoribosyltransferase
MNLEDEIKTLIRDIPDFPKAGIIFKDITPILQDPLLCKKIVNSFYDQSRHLEINCVAAVESRGFLFGMLIAQKMSVPFIPIRKRGKLPYDTFEQSYDLEYGSATIEMHRDAIRRGDKVLLHDDLLATGGTISAAARLVEKAGGTIEGFSFLVNLAFLNGEKQLLEFSKNFIGLAKYD